MAGLDVLAALEAEYNECQRCKLWETRANVVFGNGSVRADLLIIGEAPGEVEDALGSPFEGPAGQLLMDMLKVAWPDAEELTQLDSIPEGDTEEFFDVLRNFLDDYIFWTNILCCRPPDNRAPSAKEAKACKDRLFRTIYAVDPMLIIAAGGTAATLLLGSKVSVTAKRGNIFDVAIQSPVTGQPVRYPVLIILHPSFLLRGGSTARVDEKTGETFETIEDLRYGLRLLDTQYQDVFGSQFPYKPDSGEYK